MIYILGILLVVAMYFFIRMVDSETKQHDKDPDGH
jgi:hypothetical protein